MSPGDTQAQSFNQWWEENKGRIALAVLVVYTLVLGVITADQVFDLGLIPTKLDRMIAKSIKKLESEDPKLRNEGFKEVLEYGDFAIPQLVKALDRGPEVQKLAISALKRITGQNFEAPREWKEWFKRHKDEF